VLFHRGQGTRDFEEPTILEVGVLPNVLYVVGVDGDGRLDVTVSSALSQGGALFYNLGAEGFSGPRVERVSVAPSMLRVLDVDGERVNDIVAFGRSATTVSLGVAADSPPTPTFRRGDADGDGDVVITDAVFVLNYLFQSDRQPTCRDAADSNDDAVINLTDAVAVLNYLFQSGVPPADPGPTECGEDTTEDALPDCAGGC